MAAAATATFAPLLTPSAAVAAPAETPPPPTRPLPAAALAPASAATLDFVPAQPSIPDHRFSLSDFGAVGDGRTLATAPLQRAIAAVAEAGGGTLVVPAGTYLTGPLDLCSRLNLHLEAGATLLFLPEFAAYRQPDGHYRPLLLADHCDDVMVSGAGTLNGHGDAWWPEAHRFAAAAKARHERSNTSPRPRLLVFQHCRRVRVEGITLTMAPVFNLVPIACEEVTIDGVTIFNPADAPNTDGIDPSVSRRVLITRCRIDTGDDCIAVKAGGRDGGLTEDILITDCAFFHGHGCSIGSETYSGLRRLAVRHCTFDGTEIGIRLKSDRTRGGLVEDVSYSDLTMKNVGEAIVISSYYQGSTTDVGKSGPSDRAEPVTATTPHWRGIHIFNLVATQCTKDAGMILGLPEMPVDHLRLENVRILAPRGLRLAYVEDIALRGVEVDASRGEPFLVNATVRGLERRP
jgi:polygalacturonase